MDVDSLPTLEDFQRACAVSGGGYDVTTSAGGEDGIDPAEDGRQRLVLRALNYGTAASPSPDAPARTDRACAVLAAAWEACPVLEDALVDGIWLCSSSAQEGPPMQGLVAVVLALAAVPDRERFLVRLQRNLFPSLLEAAGLASERDLLKRLKVHNTQVHYKQHKFNLLQEESEGYSKLLRFLAGGDGRRPAPDRAAGDGDGRPDGDPDRRARLLELVGTFELDPNRVLDLTFDALEGRLYPTDGTVEETGPDGSSLSQREPKMTDAVAGLLDVVRVLPLTHFSSLIAFKLNSTPDGAARSLSTARTVAFLASLGFVRLEALIAEHFDPVEEHIENAHKVLWMKEKGRILAASRVSLSGSTAEDPKQAELQNRLEKALEPLKTSWPLKIVLILLQWGKWDHVKAMLSTTLWSHLCYLMPLQFASALCDEAQKRISQWYIAKVGTPGLNQSSHANDNNATPVFAHLTVDQVAKALADPLSCIVQSGYIASQPVLFCRICRLLSALLKEGGQDGPRLTQDAYNFFQTFLVPSLSLFPSNPAISTELWGVMKQLPYTARYKIYSMWRGAGLEKAGLSSSPSGKPLPNILSEMEAGKAARYVLKRLSKDNIRDMSRQLAMVTHSNPLVVYATILSQIESYDNMVEVMVEAQRFVNALGLDVLGYCILGRLSGMTGGINRSRLKEDGVNVSQWLQSLESFTGEFYKRRPFVEFRGVLSYLIRRLRDGNVMELGMLRTMLKVAGGYSFADYSPAASLNETQLEGRAGSVALKRETMSFGIVEDTSTVATNRMRQVLQNDGLGVSMLILIAQARDRILFDSTKGALKEVKLVGNLYDSCQVLMSILLEFLTNDDRGENADDDDPVVAYSKFLPSLQHLQEVSGLDLPTSWFLCRPAVLAALNRRGEDVEMDGDLEKFETRDSVRQSCSSSLPDTVWDLLSPKLIEAFYMNDLYNIFCPDGLYASEMSRIGKEVDRIQAQKATGTKIESDPLDRLNSVAKELSHNLEQQKKSVELTFSRLDEDKEDFFPSGEVSQSASRDFLVHCIYPRSMQSPDGAMYASEFSFRLHKVWTPGFSIIHYIDELILIISGALYGVTEGEAANLGILLWQTWKVVNKWRYVEGLFKKEVIGKPGSYVENDEEGEKTTKPISHKDFIQLYNKWHSAFGAAVIGCLESSEYMHTRTGLVVLTRLVDVFPTRPALGNKLMTVLEPLQDETTSRPDIRASASAYGMMLVKARDDGKWVEEDKAVAKARADKERAAAEERKRNLEKTFQELQRDSEKISAEIGPRDGQRDRNDRRREYSNPRGAVQPDSDSGGRPSNSRVTDKVNERPPEYTRMESGELMARDRREERDRDRRTSREPDRPARERETSSDDRVRGKVDGEDRRRDGGDVHRGRDDQRWPRSTPERTSKRSRPSSPVDGDDDRTNPKRPKLESDTYPTRRNAVRGDSPPRRPRSPEELSRPRARRVIRR